MPIDWHPNHLKPAERELAGVFSCKNTHHTNTNSVGVTIQPEYHDKRKVAAEVLLKGIFGSHR